MSSSDFLANDLGGVEGVPPVVEGGLDRLIRLSLAAALRREEPPPAVWQRIENRLAAQLEPAVIRPGFGRLMSRLWHGLTWLEETIFSTPCWHERLAEQRMELVCQTLAFPGVGAVSLAVI
jgi:hypothetical protein